MYKVILIDDEKQIVDGLCKMIKWAEFGFTVCATARNGLEAIPLIEQHRPDLVLTDIKMPEMDGLKLLEHISQYTSYDLEFIILSGYSEFEYAQKALKYNVKNYILKPIDEALLYKALIEIRDLLDEKELRKSLKVKSYINNIITGARPKDRNLILDEEEIFGLRFILISIHQKYGALADYNDGPSDRDLFNLLEDKMGSKNMRFIYRSDWDQCFVVVGKTLLQSFNYDINYLAVNISEHLSAYKGVDVDILIGKKVNCFNELRESIKSIALCKHKRFYEAKGTIISYDNIMYENYSKIYEDNGSVIKIINAFRKNDLERLEEGINQLIMHFCSIKAVPEIVLIHLDSIMTSVLNILSERTGDTNEVLRLYAAYKKIQNSAGIYELGRLVIEFCIFCSGFSDRNKSESQDIICKVTQYIDQNYMEPIKIIDIAERFFANPAYLGQQFIKKKGCSLKHYLNYLRIEKSKEFLKNTNLKIYEIAFKVGFDDPNYFSAKFFEMTNQTPSDYRR